MDTLFHFMIALFGGLALNTRKNYSVFFIFSAALLSIFIDADHFIFAYKRTFHTLITAVFIPMALFYLSYLYEEKRSIKLQSFFLVVLVMLMGHLLTDMAYSPEGLMLFSPLSSTFYALPKVSIMATSDFYSPLASTQGISLAIYGALIYLGLFIEDFIYFFEEKHEKARKAISDALKSFSGKAGSA